MSEVSHFLRFLCNFLNERKNNGLKRFFLIYAFNCGLVIPISFLLLGRHLCHQLFAVRTVFDIVFDSDVDLATFVLCRHFIDSANDAEINCSGRC